MVSRERDFHDAPGAMGDHLIVMHAAVRLCPGYSRHDAPSILLDGSSIDRESEHGRAVTAQLARRQDTLAEAIEAAGIALGAGGLPKGIRRQAREACEDYFYTRLGLEPGHDLTGPDRIEPSLERMPDPMYKVLSSIVEYVVDGDYEELTEASLGRLAVDDLRRRCEDEFPEALVLPPRDAFGVEAISRSDEPEVSGWAYFLDLWTETGRSRLHLEGELEEEADGRLTATLNDILP